MQPANYWMNLKCNISSFDLKNIWRSVICKTNKRRKKTWGMSLHQVD